MREISAPSTLRLHAALSVVAFLFSLNYIVGKIGLRHFAPFAFAWLRVAGSALLLHVVLRFSPAGTRESLDPSEKRRAMLYALLGVCINQLMFLEGLSLTTAHEAAILITTIPVFTLLSAIALRREQASIARIGGIAIAAAGALLIVTRQHDAGGASRFAGDVCVLINCASYGLYLVVSRGLFRARRAAPVIARLFLIGSVMMLPFCALDLWRTRWSAVPAEGWLALAGVIAGPTVAAYVLNAWTLARAESSLVAAYTYAQPVVASVLAALILGERLTPLAFAAAALIIVGVAISTRRRSELVAEAETAGL